MPPTISNYRLLLGLNDLADILPFVEKRFNDGTLPTAGFPEQNAQRFADEHAGFCLVRGWLIIGACIFRKHYAVRSGDGHLLEITPSSDPLPFATHYPLVGPFKEMPEEIFLLDC